MRFLRSIIIVFILLIHFISGLYATEDLLKNALVGKSNNDASQINKILAESDTIKWFGFSDFNELGVSYEGGIYVKTILPAQIVPNSAIAITTYLEDVDVYIDKKLVYSYRQNEQLDDYKLILPHWISTNPEYSGKQMLVWFNGSLDYFKNPVERIDYAPVGELLSFLGENVFDSFRNNLLPFVFFPIHVFIGVLSIIIFFIRIEKKEYSFLYYGLFAFVSALPDLHEPFLMSVLSFSKSNVLFILLIPIYGTIIFFLLFAKATFGTGWKNIIDHLWKLNLLALIASIFLALFDYSTFFRYVVAFVLIMSGVTVLVSFFVIVSSDYFKKIRKVKVFSFSFYAFIVLTLTSLIFNDRDSFEGVFLIGVMFLSIAMISILVLRIIDSLNKSANYKLELQKNKTELLELKQANLVAQFESLKNQINPHFLFNSLNALSSLCYPKANPEKAKKFIDEFSKIFRYILQIKDTTVVVLEEELKFLKSYYYLQKIRFENDLCLDVNVGVKDMIKLLPPLCLQILVENAIKHNKVNSKSPLKIKISTESNELVVSNNLQLRSEHEIASTKIGLKNIEERYHLVSERLPQFYVEKGEYIAKLPLLDDE